MMIKYEDVLKFEDVLKNINNIKYDKNTFYDDVICAFEDYEINGETEVIVVKDDFNYNVDYQAYINEEGSPIALIRIVDDNEVRAWW